uniref:Uncharacterized protein n=1 Tax=Panagrolaimus superbus TaxID=310955 RepID=A0A914Y0K2_9BILA
MSKLTYIRCVIYCDGKEDEKFVKYTYPLAHNLTIREIKAAACSFLKIDGGVAKLHDSDFEELIIDDSERYMVDDGVWIEFNGLTATPYTFSAHDDPTTSQASAANDDPSAALIYGSNPTNEIAPATMTSANGFKTGPPAAANTESLSSTCSFEIDGTTFDFVSSDEYKTWTALNKDSVASLYKTLKPEVDICVKKISAYDFFDCDNFRGAVVVSLFPAACGQHLPICNQAQESLFKGVVQFIAKSYISEDLPYSELSAATKILHNWLKLDIILGWSSTNSDSRLGKVFRNRKYRSRKSDGTASPAAKKRKISFGVFDLQQLKKISNEIKASVDHLAMEEMYKNSCMLRCQWYEQLNADPNYKRGIAAEVIQKFPSLKTNLQLLHYDYTCFMTTKYGRAPDFGTVLANNADDILKAAKE